MLVACAFDFGDLEVKVNRSNFLVNDIGVLIIVEILRPCLTL